MSKANQSVTISFIKKEGTVDEQGREITLNVELDSEKNVDANGNAKSKFYYGEKAYFRVYQYPAGAVLTLQATDGKISEEGSGTSKEEENVAFANTNEASVQKPVASIESSLWFGTSLGAVAAVGSKLTASKVGIGVLNINYKSNFKRYAITVPTKDYDEYPVIVYIEAE